MAQNKLKVIIFLTISSCVLISGYEEFWPVPIRNRRDVAGALDIVSNNAQPIHAEVKSEAGATASDTCQKAYKVGLKDEDVVFKAPPAKDVAVEKTARRSLSSSSIDYEALNIAKMVNRIGALVILTICLFMELYPVLSTASALFGLLM